MATLQDLCINVPKELSRQAVEQELLRRKNASYLKRMGALCAEENVFYRCQQRRPQKGKYRNPFSREEAGTQGSIVAGIRTGAYTVVVCKTKKFNP